MADGTVGVRQAPDADRLIDNEILTRDGQTVYRQRIVLATPGDETRLDYDTRTDGNPVYVGKAVDGTATSAASWVIQKLTYDTSNRLTRAQTKIGSWDGRAALSW